MALVPLRTGTGPPPRSEDVPDVLLDCHQRMRQFTALAAELAASPTAAADAVREVAAKVHRYFTVALPLHEKDEEESLFPRLLQHAPELAPHIKSLREDHAAHAQKVGALLAVCEQLQVAPERADALRASLGTAAQALADAWRVHLAAEEQDIFPAVRTALNAADREAIRQEMKERRARLPR
jgi:iron-sulfur cluster repair protein YtfE (RIC family)